MLGGSAESKKDYMLHNPAKNAILFTSTRQPHTPDAWCSTVVAIGHRASFAAVVWAMPHVTLCLQMLPCACIVYYHGCTHLNTRLACYHGKLITVNSAEQLHPMCKGTLAPIQQVVELRPYPTTTTTATITSRTPDLSSSLGSPIRTICMALCMQLHAHFNP